MDILCAWIVKLNILVLSFLSLLIYRFIVIIFKIIVSTLVAQLVKSPPLMQDTHVHSLRGEDPLEKEIATHFSTLAWKIPRTEEPGRLQSTGLQRVEHDWVTSLSLSLTVNKIKYTFIWYMFFYKKWGFFSYTNYCFATEIVKLRIFHFIIL